LPRGDRCQRQRRRDGVGRDGVDAHPGGRHLRRHSAHQADHRRLGGAVRDGNHAAAQAGDAGGADDAAAAARHHDARGVLEPRQHSAGVDGHDAVEVGEVHGAERWPPAPGGARDAGVVEHDVELAVAGHCEVHGGGDLRLVGDVAVGVAARVVGSELGGNGTAEVVLDVGDDDPRPVSHELGCGRLADAARAPGDDGDLSSQPTNQFLRELAVKK